MNTNYEVVSLPSKSGGYSGNMFINIPPFHKNMLITSFMEGEIKISISLNEELEFRCVFESGGNVRSYTFQPIQLMIGGPGIDLPQIIEGVKISFEASWDIIDGKVERNIKLNSTNGYLTLKYKTSKHYELKVGGNVRIPFVKVFPDLNPFAIASQEERHLLATIQELDERLDGKHQEQVFKKEYDIIRVGSLLRQLLLDDGGSIPRFIKKTGAGLEFVIKCYQKELEGIEDTDRNTKMIMMALSVERTPGEPKRALTLAEFLSTPSAIIDGSKVSVREVIKAVANGKGGNHAKLKKGLIEQEKLLSVDKEYLTSHLEYSLHLLFNIGRVVLIALKPLVAALESQK